MSSEDALGVVSVLGTEEAKNSFRFVVVVAVLHPARDLAVGEFTSCFTFTKLFESALVVLVLDMTVGEEHSDGSCACVNWEVNKFGHF